MSRVPRAHPLTSLAREFANVLQPPWGEEDEDAKDQDQGAKERGAGRPQTPPMCLMVCSPA